MKHMRGCVRAAGGAGMLPWWVRAAHEQAYGCVGAHTHGRACAWAHEVAYGGVYVLPHLPPTVKRNRCAPAQRPATPPSAVPPPPGTQSARCWC